MTGRFSKWLVDWLCEIGSLIKYSSAGCEGPHCSSSLQSPFSWINPKDGMGISGACDNNSLNE